MKVFLGVQIKTLYRIGKVGQPHKKAFSILKRLVCTQRDSNPHQQNRNLQFYPLNYGYFKAQIYKIAA